MKRRKIKYISVILAVMTIILTVLPGCSEDTGSGYTFKMNLESNPRNLDPQLASDKPSMIVISNMMSGLVRLSESGAIEPDAAESYSISENGLVYTFEIKKNITWESVTGFKAKLTADDFVFAFQRIFDSNALFSPYVNDFLCIKNAASVSSGMADMSSLGVKATGEYTLQIELEYPYYNFLEMLTTTAAMPCNRAFFESTKGRYGLAADAAASNGAFYIKEWNYDPYWNENYIIMKRNRSNSAEDFVYPYSINFFISDDSSRDESDYLNGTVDCFVLEGYNSKILEGNKSSPCSVKTFGLLLNTNSKYFKSKEIRYALAASFSKEPFSEVKSDRYTPAYGLIPPSITVMGRNYRDIIPDSTLSIYDRWGAFTAWKLELEAMNIISVDGVKITVPESFTGTDFLDIVTEQWQQNLDFFCGVEIVSANEYALKMSEGTFDIILTEIDTSGGGAADYLKYFTAKGADISGYTDYNAMGYIQRLGRSDRLSDAAGLLAEAERQIADNAVFIPLVYGNEYFVCNKNMADIAYSPMSGTVNFRYAKKYN